MGAKGWSFCFAELGADGLTTAVRGDLKKRTQWLGGKRGVFGCRPLAALGHPYDGEGDPGDNSGLARERNLSCQIAGGQCFERLAARRGWRVPRKAAKAELKFRAA